MTIGENIKKIRKERGITQKQSGDRCNINEANIRKYENGKQNPKKETIQKIADALGVHYFELDEYALKQELDSIEKPKFDLDNRAIIINGIIAMLKEIYGNVQKKDIQGKYGKTFYYLVGMGNDSFVLHDSDIDKLFDYSKTSISSIVEIIKEERTEQQVIDEKLKILNDPKLKKLLD